MRLANRIWPGGPPELAHPAVPCRLGAFLRSLPLPESPAIVFVETSAAWAPRLRRKGFRIVPESVRWKGRPVDLVSTLAHPGDSLARNLALAHRAGFRSAVWESTPDRRELFWERYLVPHARRRFGAEANLPDRKTSERICRGGRFLVVHRGSSALPAAMALSRVVGSSVRFISLGTLDADPEWTSAGAQTALYEAGIRWALDRGMDEVDFGRSVPMRRDGVAWFKWQWGLRPVVDTTQAIEIGVRLSPTGAPVARRFLALEPLVRVGRRIEAWQ